MLRLFVLGAIDLRRNGDGTQGDGKNGGGEVVDELLKQPKRLALLIYLAVARPRGFHRRDKLLGLFWPDLDTEHARASLRKAVYVLRGVLGENVIISRGDEEVGVDPEALWCDAVAFEEALEHGRLAKALELYRGPFLQGFFVPAAPEFDQWVDAERQRLCEVAAKAAWTLAEQFETGDQVTVATQWVWKAVRLAPDDERRVRKAMRMLAVAGDKAGAIKLYEEFARHIKKMYEAEPSADTQRLLRDIREGRFPPKDGGSAGAAPGVRP